MYELRRYLLLTLDPVHVGTGGYRLGRVDLSIAREPGTRLPKIPGTSLSGAIRQYAAYRYGKPTCAGQKGHCTQPSCPICYTFGYATGASGGHQGTVRIFDAHILLFPVHSMAGPVWVSTPTRLHDWGLITQRQGELKDGEFVTNMGWNQPLNLGWLMLTRSSESMPTIGNVGNMASGQAKEAWAASTKRLILVTDKLFSQIVNSNLEVRTSVSIDPETGAAEEKALFTYEAIPRATWLICDVVQDDYREGHSPWSNNRPVTRQAMKQNNTWQENSGRPIYPDPQNGGQPAKEDGREKGWCRPLDVVRAGLELAELLGLGGMGTRGFGRVRLIAEWEPQGGGGR